MENGARLRVQKRKGFKRGKKHALKKVVDYLISDTFMYAPMLSSPPPDFRSPDTLPSSARVVELKKPIENKTFLEQFGDYMRSDVYMYATLAGPPHSPSPKESLLPYGRIRMSVSTSILTMKVNQPNDRLGNANQRSTNHLSQSGPSDRHTQGHKETVNHSVYQTCHPNSATGKVTLNSQLAARC